MDTNFSKAKIFMVTAVVAAVFISPSTLLSFAQAQTEFQPVAPSIGAKVPLTYFGPAPSTFQPDLVGPLKLLRAGQVDVNANTVTLPLYHGQIKGNSTTGNVTKNIWYVLTDTNDKGNADQLGLNFSPKLTYAAVGQAVRVATLEKDTSLTFNAGTVDFSPNRTLVPGAAPNAFPPKTFSPGSVGDKDYTPLIRVQNAGNHVYDAPIVAANVDAKRLSALCNGSPDYSLVHDKVLKICPGTGTSTGTVTLKLTQGFSFGRPVLYLSLDSSNPLAATLEDVTYSVRLGDIVTGHDDSFGSATERLFALANGPTGKDNPQRQGFNSAIIDGLNALNVLGGLPTVATD
ncbi:MAG: hypothetical protein M3Y53_11620, partial [Thermoproteota archaeon]|nr:hypothetical protein [Thermoproteota archaeon]